MTLKREDYLDVISASVDMGKKLYPMTTRVYQVAYMAASANAINNATLKQEWSEPVRRNEIIKLAAACVRYLEEGYE